VGELRESRSEERGSEMSFGGTGNVVTSCARSVGSFQSSGGVAANQNPSRDNLRATRCGLVR
jgi:hypothetical protein